MTTVVTIGPAATMIGAAHLHGEIATALAAGTDLSLDVDALADVDLSFVQLVEAARRDAAARGVSLTLARPANPCLVALLDRAGVTSATSPGDISFWLHGDSHQ